MRTHGGGVARLATESGVQGLADPRVHVAAGDRPAFKGALISGGRAGRVRGL